MKILLITCVALFSYVGISQIETEKDLDFEILKNLELFELVYKNIDLYYVDESNPGELMKTGINAMLAELDPYTNFIPESKMEDYKLMTTGQYGGIGAIIRQVDNSVMIIDPYENFPAHKVGLLAGDIFVEIDKKNVENLSSSEVSDKLKGQPGKPVELKIKRNDKLIEFTVIREEIKLSPVPYSGIVRDSIGYIKLNSFTQTASKDVYDAFIELKEKENITKLILDLRGNGGGLLNQATQIVNFFIEKGSDIVEIKGRTSSVNQSFNARLKPIDLEIPIVVLIDGRSASASEIVSGALQDLDRAVIVGETSFGKGLVQRPLDLKYNAKIKVTIAKYYTPSGRCIQKLDYSNKKVGEHATEVSDESLKKFKTKNGRDVIDGRGVEPDVTIEIFELSRLTATLIIENIIFNFVTNYRENHSEIDEIYPFHLTNEDYADFKTYVINKNIEYSTGSSEVLEILKKEAKQENLFDESEVVYNQLLELYKPSLSRDLEKYQNELRILIEDEIIGRYFYQTGRLRQSLTNDPQIEEAIKILNDSKRYQSILNVQN